MENIIVAVLLGVIAIGCFVIGGRQLCHKGFLLIGLLFIVNAIEAILQTNWLILFSIGIVMITIVYAIVSSAMIEKKTAVAEYFLGEI